ncbi:MAG: hypothetical protein OXC37_05915, partial [Bdellovibrionaceae bacterium]|nr:hypothetical protein [Pseudobdellovibrionaceae bacterium]
KLKIFSIEQFQIEDVKLIPEEQKSIVPVNLIFIFILLVSVDFIIKMDDQGFVKIIDIHLDDDSIVEKLKSKIRSFKNR